MRRRTEVSHGGLKRGRQRGKPTVVVDRRYNRKL
jgi:hypothetical protein